MKKSEVQIGGRYRAKVSGSDAPVRVTRVSSYGGWDAVNLHTGRKIRVRTAARLRPDHAAQRHALGVIRESTVVVNGVQVHGIELRENRARAAQAAENGPTDSGSILERIIQDFEAAGLEVPGKLDPCDEQCRAGHSVDCDVRRSEAINDDTAPSAEKGGQ